LNNGTAAILSKLWNLYHFGDLFTHFIASVTIRFVAFTEWLTCSFTSLEHHFRRRYPFIVTVYWMSVIYMFQNEFSYSCMFCVCSALAHELFTV